MRRFALLSLLCVAGCGRYDEFSLPRVERDVPKGRWVWEARPEPVLQRGASGWDSSDALNPSVVRLDTGYLNLYSGFDGRTWHTGAANSPDGLAWTKRGKVLSPDQPWEGDYIAANGAVLRVGNEFLYWYQAGKPPKIGLARSADGSQWRKEPLPVLDLGPRGAWDERGVADPYVVQFGGAYYMYYLGQDRARRQRLGVARSADGAAWTKLRTNPVLEIGEDSTFDENGLGEPAVWHAHGAYWMLYTGRDRREYRRMGLATSLDGVRWSRVASPLIAGERDWNSKVVCDATVEVLPERVRVWFGGGNAPSPDERLNGQIGYGELRWQSQ